MLQSLQNTVREPSYTEASIRQSLSSPAGMKTVWVIVEAEDDLDVYKKFMRRDTTEVKISKDKKGKKGYANVELIVRRIKQVIPKAHIFGIRDADYTRFLTDYKAPDNIFLTDRRDLEMMLLDAQNVQDALTNWTADYDAAFAKCIPICRYFGYLRIYNEIAGLSVTFHNHLHPSKYWDFNRHDLDPEWKTKSTDKFVSLAKGVCTVADVDSFISDHALEQESMYDICRGRDFIKLLSVALVRNEYSDDNIMAEMTLAYSLIDFKATQLYSSIQAWQKAEGVEALIS